MRCGRRRLDSLSSLRDESLAYILIQRRVNQPALVLRQVAKRLRRPEPRPFLDKLGERNGPRSRPSSRIVGSRRSEESTRSGCGPGISSSRRTRGAGKRRKRCSTRGITWRSWSASPEPSITRSRWRTGIYRPVSSCCDVGRKRNSVPAATGRASSSRSCGCWSPRRLRR
jgi:hypothetical protein